MILVENLVISQISSTISHVKNYIHMSLVSKSPSCVSCSTDWTQQVANKCSDVREMTVAETEEVVLKSSQSICIFERRVNQKVHDPNDQLGHSIRSQ